MPGRIPKRSDLPPGPTSEEQVWKALADAAAALHAVASALAGSSASSRPSISPTPPPDDAVTVADAVNELLVAKIRAGRSDEYVRQLRHALELFSRGRGRTPLQDVTVDDVERWIHSCRVSPRTIRGRIQYVRTLFSWGMRRNFCSRNPAAAVDLPDLSPEPPGIHTPQEVRTVLEAARARSPALVRVLALRYFAGLRAAEVARLEERDLGDQYVTVPAHKAKTRSRRLVRIHRTLRAWLDLGGELPGRTMEQQIWELTRAIGVPWPRNCARHSWVSYHLAAFGSAATTALEAGHSEAMLFANYRALVTPEAAAEFWAITPITGEADSSTRTRG